MALALIFNYSLYLYASNDFQNNIDSTGALLLNPDKEAKRIALEFLTGYVVEKSLAIIFRFS